jgi:hypothetical protein
MHAQATIGARTSPSSPAPTGQPIRAPATPGDRGPRLHAIAVLTLVGACGGFFIVPLNALLQECGHDSVGAGHAIAVQNLAENLMMLIMIGAYTLAVHSGAAVQTTAAGFGGFLAVSIALLWLYRTRKITQRAAEGLLSGD